MLVAPLLFNPGVCHGCEHAYQCKSTLYCHRSGVSTTEMATTVGCEIALTISARPAPALAVVVPPIPRTPSAIAANLATCEACEFHADTDADDTRTKCSACKTCDKKRTVERWVSVSIGRCPEGKWQP